MCDVTVVGQREPARGGWRSMVLAGCVVTLLIGCGTADRPAPAPPASAVAGGAPVTGAATTTAAAASPERGRYIVQVGGCNDCHTPGFMENGPAVPEAQWLTGGPVGWKGPWGTTYPSNLRLFARDFDEDAFVAVVRARNTRPPMPWPSLHAMSDDDLRSLFRYIRSLPVAGERMPEYVPPGQEPTTAYIDLVPQMPKGHAASR